MVGKRVDAPLGRPPCLYAMKAPRLRLAAPLSAPLCLDILLRFLMGFIFVQMEHMSPFTRHIHPDEMWLYRNPRRESYVGNTTLWGLALLAPFLLATLAYLLRRDKHDFTQILLAVTLALGINCILTDMVKLIVGRPRPDFFWRCFPDGEMNAELQCTGDPEDVKEGRKSFPSGHSSISFSSLGTLSWWCMGKLQVWSASRGSSWRLLLSVLPLFTATAVSLSRTCDYHHHWQDVFVGAVQGLFLSYVGYRQYYPALDSPDCSRPFPPVVPGGPHSPSQLKHAESKDSLTAALVRDSSSENLTEKFYPDTEEECNDTDKLRRSSASSVRGAVKWI